MFMYYITDAWFCIEEHTYDHLPYTSQMEAQIPSFKQNSSILVQINFFFIWEANEKLH